MVTDWPVVPSAIKFIFDSNPFLYKNMYFFYKNFLDAKEKDFIKKYVKKGMVVVDVGAHIGYYSTLFLECVGSHGKVFVFEPEAKNLRYLNNLFRKYKNVNVYPFAVGEENKKTKLYISQGCPFDHVTFRRQDLKKYTKVSMVSLDKILKNQKKVDCVKIDTEGSELSVLKGMKKILKRFPNIILMIEYLSHGRDSEEIKNLLNKNGFNLIYISHLGGYYTNILAQKRTK